MSLKINTNIKLKNSQDKVYCHEPYAQELNNLYENYQLKLNKIASAPKEGEIVQVQDLVRVNKDELVVLLASGEEAYISLRKEKKFFAMLGIDSEHFINLLSHKNPFDEEFFKWVHIDSVGDIVKASYYKAQTARTQKEFAEQLNNPTQAYVAKVIAKNGGGYLIDVLGVDGFLPGSLAAPNKILDFDAFIGKEIKVMVESFLQDSNTFIFSHKKYISHVLPEIINRLKEGDQYTGYVTGQTSFGVFFEFNEILTGLLHKSEMTEESVRIFNNEKFKPGTPLTFWIKQISHDNKIILTELDPAIQLSELQALKTSVEGSTKPLSFISKKPYGYIFQITPDHIGLLSTRDAREGGIENTLNNLNRGDEYRLTISKINPETGKIYLKIYDEARVS